MGFRRCSWTPKDGTRRAWVSPTPAYITTVSHAVVNAALAFVSLRVERRSRSHWSPPASKTDKTMPY